MRRLRSLAPGLSIMCRPIDDRARPVGSRSPIKQGHPMKSPQDQAADQASRAINQAADEAVNAANKIRDDAAHAANKRADDAAAAANKAADEQIAASRKS